MAETLSDQDATVAPQDTDLVGIHRPGFATFKLAWSVLKSLMSTALKHGGSNEVATATSGANVIPKAGSDGKLAIGFIPVGTTAGTVAAADDARLAAAADLATHVANTSNPHSVTKSQVGLGNADNTSDANKPISTATQAALDLKAPLASPALTGTPTAPTALAATSNTQIATTAHVHAVVDAVINAAPGALDTLDELAAALGDDPNFATTVANAVAAKLAKASNLSDLTDASAARTNLGLGTAATKNVGSTSGDVAAGDVAKVGFALDENAGIALPGFTLSADGKWAGITTPGTAGYAQTFGDLNYLDPTDGRWEKTDANAVADADGDARGLIGIVVSAGAADGSACTILLLGVIRADAAFPTFTKGAPIYVSETAGAVTQTRPATTDAVIRVIGFAATADSLLFQPSSDYITPE